MVAASPQLILLVLLAAAAAVHGKARAVLDCTALDVDSSACVLQCGSAVYSLSNVRQVTAYDPQNDALIFNCEGITPPHPGLCDASDSVRCMNKSDTHTHTHTAHTNRDSSWLRANRRG
jgi:hypothetical protein